MDKVYREIINERIEQYGVSNLADEVLSILTGIPVIVVKNSIDNYYDLSELIKFIQIYNFLTFLTINYETYLKRIRFVIYS